MIKLTAKNDWQHATWYFRDRQDLEKFKYVFTNHGCSIAWEEETKDKFPEMSENDFKSLDENPETRAESDLKWAFNSYLPDNPSADISASIAERIMQNL